MISFDMEHTYVVAEWLMVPMFLLLVVALVILAKVTTTAYQYKRRTMAGLKMANYARGLKLYMEMAEAERMRFLQSVDGAETSGEGVVKLYERLLPYAALFELEESWMNELSKYYREMEMPEPDWYATMYAINMHDFMQTVRSSAITPSSSASSGSGGGGFSGGGGGGGGGGGW